jgi:hypothetical protein
MSKLEKVFFSLYLVVFLFFKTVCELFAHSFFRTAMNSCHDEIIIAFLFHLINFGKEDKVLKKTQVPIC